MDSFDRKLANIVIRISFYTARLKFLPPPLHKSPQRRFTSPSPTIEVQISPRSPPYTLPTLDVVSQYPIANIRTVFDLWYEWTVKINKNSIKTLNKAYNAAWRKYINVRNILETEDRDRRDILYYEYGLTYIKKHRLRNKKLVFSRVL